MVVEVGDRRRELRPRPHRLDLFHHQAAFGAHFETYTFTLTDVMGDGLRIVGEAGGRRHFVSAGEIEVWGTVLGGRKYPAAA